MSPTLRDFYRGRTVLVTGHTGFKGAWLALWLGHLGARVVGYAQGPPTDPSLFAAGRLSARLLDLRGDVRDFARLEAVFAEHRPAAVFHLAAQPLVRASFASPRETFEVNVMGTLNLLEAARRSGGVRACVVVTSDKCYRERGAARPYREDDELGGGHDPYSASKAAAEVVAALYRDERFQRATATPSSLPVASARAGNVIGGGDWAADRLLPDVVRAVVGRRPLRLRYPRALRPWQHVLEPLSGYLWLAARLGSEPERFARAWNFGPADEDTLSVRDVVDAALRAWPALETALTVEEDPHAAEAAELRLDCDLARRELGWRAVWNTPRAVAAAVEWYRRFYADPARDASPDCLREIEAYTADARALGLPWAAAG